MDSLSLFNIDEWCVSESNFSATRHPITESIFSIGNGHMGQRANFEEAYSGNSLKGNYIGGVFFPDKTRVGWWKIGYPDYFAKVLNAPSWTNIHLYANNELLDLATAHIHSFTRTLNMKEGTLKKTCTAELKNGVQLAIESCRFISMHSLHVGAIRYTIRLLQKNCTITIDSFIDSDVRNQDANYNDNFWVSLQQTHNSQGMAALDKTRETPYDVPQFSIATAANHTVLHNGIEQTTSEYIYTKAQQITEQFICQASAGDTITIYKYASQISTLQHTEDTLIHTALTNVDAARTQGFDSLLQDHIQAWAAKWETSDITISGDPKAQQGIRFNIFHLLQTYSGHDSRLNIGPKGFTGEKYGGGTYWDTEAFCLPFYMATQEEHIARNLLLYRHKQLDRAIKNAKKLGFSHGAALYPMVTMTGDECHNEWEITFEEIHRNGAIAFAIYNYTQYTNDRSYIVEHGLEVLIAISRFWTQRVNLSPTKKVYMILGVTGPNEYENNVNNNWYTNYIARWCLQYTLDTISWIKRVANQEYEILKEKINFDENYETLRWADIAKNLYLPEDHVYGIILQQDGFLDKELSLVKDIPPHELPLNQHWSWDRILRSCYIKQADVVQGLYMFEEDFDEETIKRNFDFYESRCVHESSLSPCIHSIVAAKIGNIEKAYTLYLRTARLDLDDYNKEAHEGLHITSMAGTWSSIVQGFAGMRWNQYNLMLAPKIPQAWDSYSFCIRYRNTTLLVQVAQTKLSLRLKKGKELAVIVYGEHYTVTHEHEIHIPLRTTE